MAAEHIWIQIAAQGFQGHDYSELQEKTFLVQEICWLLLYSLGSLHDITLTGLRTQLVGNNSAYSCTSPAIPKGLKCSVFYKVVRFLLTESKLQFMV